MKLSACLIFILLLAPLGAQAQEPATASDGIAALYKAAEQNNGDAQLQLGEALSEDVGAWQVNDAGKVAWTPPADVNYAEAYFWLSLAVNNKVADAGSLRDDIAAHLTPAEIALSDMRVRHWREKLAALSLPQ